MRITSLGYSPVNQSTNNKNQMQNPAFKGTAEVITEKLADVVGPKGQVGLEGFRAVVADLQESFAGLGVAVKPVLEELRQGLKAIMRVPGAVDMEAATACGSHQDQCVSGKLKGVKISYIVEPQAEHAKIPDGGRAYIVG